MKMQIGEIARQSGVTVRTLQYYDSIGLLKPAEVSESGYRYYDETSLERLRRILYYKELGFPLREIAVKMPSGQLLERRRALEREKARIERLIERVDGELSQTAKVSPWFDKICRDYNYSGFAYYRGEGENFFAWGKADYENDIGFTPRCRFPLGLATLQFTAYCVLLFAEKGLISLDSAVSEHFPEIDGADKVTVRELLSMTSGIRSDKIAEEYNSLCAEFSEPPWEAARYEWAKIERAFVPTDIPEKITFGGEREFCFNIANYEILRLILEKTANLPFAEILSEHIFKPLEMRDTALSGNSDAAAYIDGKHVEGGFPSEVVSTAEDLAKFYAAVLDGRLLPFGKYLPEIPEDGFGCGWYRNGDSLSFDSDFGGFALETRLRPDEGSICISLRNKPPVPDNVDRVMYYPVERCDDGYVKLEVWETDGGAEFGVYSVKVFDRAANELYSAENSGGYLIEVKNDGEKRQASEFAEKYFYELQLKDILGERFDPDETYIIEAKAHCDTLRAAQLGCVYQSGGEWISGCYCVFRAPWVAYDLFMEQLRVCSAVK